MTGESEEAAIFLVTKLVKNFGRIKGKNTGIYRDIMMNIIYRHTISVEDYQELRATVKWDILVDEQAQNGLNGSTYIISCYDNQKIVGCSRIIWDGGYFALLADVIVKPEYQHMGIGSSMIKTAIEFVQSRLKKDWKIKIVLMSAKGKEGFYKRHGFYERPTEYGGSGMEMLIALQQ